MEPCGLENVCDGGGVDDLVCFTDFCDSPDTSPALVSNLFWLLEAQKL